MYFRKFKIWVIAIVLIGLLLGINLALIHKVLDPCPENLCSKLTTFIGPEVFF